jgi:hypothetical protein
MNPKSEQVLFWLAASAGRACDTGAALQARLGAIAASPGNRALAKSDSDFDPIGVEDAFIDLVYAQAS